MDRWVHRRPVFPSRMRRRLYRGLPAVLTQNCDQELPPDTILVQTNLSGALTDIDEDPRAPDANWWDLIE